MKFAEYGLLRSSGGPHDHGTRGAHLRDSFDVEGYVESIRATFSKTVKPLPNGNRTDQKVCVESLKALLAATAEEGCGLFVVVRCHKAILDERNQTGSDPLIPRLVLSPQTSDQTEIRWFATTSTSSAARMSS